MVLTSLSVIVASAGRPSLRETLESVGHQLRPGDELVVDVNDDSPHGHKARNRRLEEARGDAVLFMDDDDYYVAGALDAVREGYAQAPGRLHIFRMLYIENDFVLWEDADLRPGNVSTQMICAPGDAGSVGRFGDRYEGDYDFCAHTCSLLGPPVWHDDVIALVHHPLMRGVRHRPAA